MESARYSARSASSAGWMSQESMSTAYRDDDVGSSDSDSSAYSFASLSEDEQGWQEGQAAMSVLERYRMDTVEDERLLNGTRKRWFIEARRTLDNVAIRPLFPKIKVAQEMCDAELTLGAGRPMQIDTGSKLYEGMISERGLDDRPLTPVGKSINETLSFYRRQRAREDAQEGPNAQSRNREFLDVVKEGKVQELSALLDAKVLPATAGIVHGDGGGERYDSGGGGGMDEEEDDNHHHHHHHHQDARPAATTMRSRREVRRKDRALAAKLAAGWDALMWASHLNHLTVTEKLLHAGIGPSFEDPKTGWTALMWAAHNNHVAIVQALLRAEASVNHQNRFGATALMWAARQNKLESAQLLIDAHAEIDVVCNDGNSALTWAAKAGHAGMVVFLLKHRAKINHANLDGETALMGAVAPGHIQVVQALLDFSIECDSLVKNQFNQDALAIANIYETSPVHCRIAKLLQARNELIKERFRAEQERLRLLSQQSRRSRSTRRTISRASTRSGALTPLQLKRKRERLTQAISST